MLWVSCAACSYVLPCYLYHIGVYFEMLSRCFLYDAWCSSRLFCIQSLRLVKAILQLGQTFVITFT
jgi:hypothetical protein